MASEQVWTAIIVGIPAFILGLLGLWRSLKADRKAEQNSSAELIVNRLNKHIDELQEDGAAWRAENATLRAELKEEREARRPRKEST